MSKTLFSSLSLLTLLVSCNSEALFFTPVAVQLESNTSQLVKAGEVQLTATPRNLKGVSKIEFYRNGTLIGSDTTAPYTFTDAFSSPLQNGTHAYTAKAHTSTPVLTSLPVQVKVQLPVLPLVTFVTDDASKQDHLKLLPIFKEKNVPAVAGIVTAFVGKDAWHLNQQDMLELQDAGWELASHTRTHPDLGSLSPEDLKKEILDSKTELESLGAKPVTTVVYPYLAPSDAVQQLAATAYSAGLAPYGGINTRPMNKMALKRVALGAFTGANTLADYKAQVDLAVAQQGWLIFMLHPFSDQFDATQEQHLRDTIDYIKGKNIPVVTVKQALQLLEQP